MDESYTGNGETYLPGEGMRTYNGDGGGLAAPTGWSVKEKKSRMASRFPGWGMHSRLRQPQRQQTWDK